jgi:hypothetical protein
MGLQEALSQERVLQEGFVDVLLTVEHSGSISGCLIAKSTAPVMNDATCRIFLAHARFEQRTGKNAGSWIKRMRVRYRILDKPAGN